MFKEISINLFGFLVRLFKKKYTILIVSYGLSALVMLIVYYTGGTTKAYTNLMYLPIAIVSGIYGRKQGVIHAIISGLLLGPYMPLDSILMIAQSPLNWMIRLSLFTINALIIGIFADYSKKRNKQLINHLTHDSITNFKNLEWFKYEKDQNQKVSFIALSVNDYEELFSFFGYEFSNKIILAFSHKLDLALKPFKLIQIYRYQGMEFIIKTLKQEDTTEILEALNQLNKQIITVNHIPIYIELRFGVSKNNDGISNFERVRFALIALRQAYLKDKKVEEFEQRYELYFKDVVEIASSFTKALKKNEIKVAYQNLYGSNPLNIYGVELLARWIKEDQSEIFPNAFIPIIEKTEYIHDFTKHIIDLTIDFIKKQDDHQRYHIVSINFSTKNLEPENVNYLIEQIKINQIQPGRVQIEITEETLIRNKDRVLEYIELLKNSGVLIAIDDFGSGYSSYQYISDLPINTIKIDMALIAKLTTSSRNKTLVKSIVDFCKENDIITVAEGVETKEIADACIEIGIDYLQGFYYHRPEINMI